jgi:hypothetical protein
MDGHYDRDICRLGYLGDVANNTERSSGIKTSGWFCNEMMKNTYKEYPILDHNNLCHSHTV